MPSDLDTEVAIWPLFALHTPILPGERLPLRVFEPRYKRMLQDMADAGSDRFVVARIIDGQEVGAVAKVASIGCLASIERMDVGRPDVVGIVAQGSQRVRVEPAGVHKAGYPFARCAPMPNVGSAHCGLLVGALAKKLEVADRTLYEVLAATRAPAHVRQAWLECHDAERLAQDVEALLGSLPT